MEKYNQIKRITGMLILVILFLFIAVGLLSGFTVFLATVSISFLAFLAGVFASIMVMLKENKIPVLDTPIQILGGTNE